MLVVLAAVAAAFRMISDKRERPVAIEHAARGRGSDVIKVLVPSLCSVLSLASVFRLQYSTMILQKVGLQE